jgi:hypothetical protein
MQIALDEHSTNRSRVLVVEVGVVSVLMVEVHRCALKIRENFHEL